MFEDVEHIGHGFGFDAHGGVLCLELREFGVVVGAVGNDVAHAVAFLVVLEFLFGVGEVGEEIGEPVGYERVRFGSFGHLLPDVHVVVCGHDGVEDVFGKGHVGRLHLKVDHGGVFGGDAYGEFFGEEVGRVVVARQPDVGYQAFAFGIVGSETHGEFAEAGVDDRGQFHVGEFQQSLFEVFDPDVGCGAVFVDADAEYQGVLESVEVYGRIRSDLDGIARVEEPVDRGHQPDGVAAVYAELAGDFAEHGVGVDDHGFVVGRSVAAEQRRHVAHAGFQQRSASVVFDYEA